MRNNIIVIRLTFYLLVVVFKYNKVSIATNCLINSWLDNWKLKSFDYKPFFSKDEYLDLIKGYN